MRGPETIPSSMSGRVGSDETPCTSWNGRLRYESAFRAGHRLGDVQGQELAA
jgi:hypothetical protein